MLYALKQHGNGEIPDADSVKQASGDNTGFKAVGFRAAEKCCGAAQPRRCDALPHRETSTEAGKSSRSTRRIFETGSLGRGDPEDRGCFWVLCPSLALGKLNALTAVRATHGCLPCKRAQSIPLLQTAEKKKFKKIIPLELSPLQAAHSKSPQSLCPALSVPMQTPLPMRAEPGDARCCWWLLLE